MCGIARTCQAPWAKPKRATNDGEVAVDGGVLGLGFDTGSVGHSARLNLRTLIPSRAQRTRE
jgi:hypothetical protein